MTLNLSGSTGISGVDGSASTPALQGTDANTGIHYPAVDTVGISTGGTERLRIDSSGNVGIGTSSPGRKLEIANGDIRLTDGYVLQWGTAGNYIYGNSASNFLAAVTSGSERARIDSSGRLLVGTSSSLTDNPFQSLFQLAKATSAALEQGFASYFLFPGTSAARRPIVTFNRSRGTSLGVNTAVASGDYLGSITFNGTEGTNFLSAADITAQVDSGTISGTSMPGKLVFSTTADGASSPTERMRINAAGGLKVSTTGSYISNTSGRHEFNQTASNTEALYLRNTNANPFGMTITYSGAAPNGTGNEFLYCFDGALRARIQSNGGLANYQSNDSNLCDEREKKNIEALDSTWGCLKNWELKKFHYNEDADTDDKRYGVIAQQVAPHCPEVITEWVKQKAEPTKLDEEGNEIEPAKEEIVRMGVKEQQMMWMAIKALQEAQTRIETLEAEVAALKAS